GLAHKGTIRLASHAARSSGGAGSCFDNVEVSVILSSSSKGLAYSGVVLVYVMRLYVVQTLKSSRHEAGNSSSTCTRRCDNPCSCDHRNCVSRVWWFA